MGSCSVLGATDRGSYVGRSCPLPGGHQPWLETVSVGTAGGRGCWGFRWVEARGGAQHPTTASCARGPPGKVGILTGPPLSRPLPGLPHDPPPRRSRAGQTGWKPRKRRRERKKQVPGCDFQTLRWRSGSICLLPGLGVIPRTLSGGREQRGNEHRPLWWLPGFFLFWKRWPGRWYTARHVPPAWALSWGQSSPRGLPWT